MEASLASLDTNVSLDDGAFHPISVGLPDPRSRQGVLCVGYVHLACSYPVMKAISV
jgi:hypothetical protein